MTILSILALVAGAYAQLFGFRPMGGRGDNHSNYVGDAAGSIPYFATAGTLKWSYHPPSSVKAVTRAAIGTMDFPNVYEFRVYFGADDSKLYCVQVSINQDNTFSTSVAWTHTCDGVPTGTPTLGLAGSTEAAYVSDSGGRVRCVNASDGSLIWRSSNILSSGVSLTPPLYMHAAVEAVLRVYVGRNDDSSHGSLFGFETYYSDVPTAQGPASQATALHGPVVKTPAAIEYAPGDAVPASWFILASTTNGYLEQWYDDPDLGLGVVWTYNTGKTCQTWPMVSSGSSPIYFGCYDGSNHATVYAFFPDGTLAWDDPVTSFLWSKVPPQNVNLGKLAANPAEDEGTSNSLFYPALDLGSGTGKPTLSRVLDEYVGYSRGVGYVLTVMPSDSDDLVTSCVFVASNVYFLTSTGKFYVVGANGGAPAYGWPKTTNKTIPTQDIAIDYDHGTVFITSDGYVMSYWGT